MIFLLLALVYNVVVEAAIKGIKKLDRKIVVAKGMVATPEIEEGLWSPRSECRHRSNR